MKTNKQALEQEIIATDTLIVKTFQHIDKIHALVKKEKRKQTEAEKSSIQANTDIIDTAILYQKELEARLKELNEKEDKTNE